jgi:hypothetical protein
MAREVWLGVVLAIDAAACSAPDRSPSAVEAPVEAAQAPAPRPLEALEGEWLQALEHGEAVRERVGSSRGGAPRTRALDSEDGRGLGSVSIPVGAREPRRIVVAMHGAASRPDWMCSAVRASVGPEPFVVCPHSVSRFTTEASWSSAAQMRERIDAAVGAVIRRFAAYADTTDALFIGHSQGAMLAPAALVIAGETRFRHAVFFEGLPRDPAAARAALAAAGVERLLVVSGQSGWKDGHARFARSFSGTTTAARHVHLDAGHFFDGRVHQLIRDELAWVVGDRSTWAHAVSADHFLTTKRTLPP